MDEALVVRIVKAALDEGSTGIILRGVIDPKSLRLLQIGPYQREIMPLNTISELAEAIEKGSVPDIELGVRGSNYMERKRGVFELAEDVFIIDGLQRVTAAKELLKRGGKPSLGATIHFGTDEELERQRFRILNASRTKVSSNILLRNCRTESPAIDTFCNLSMHERDFVMCGKVSWSQRMARDHFITALTFLKVIGALHSHIGPGLSSNWHDISRGIQTIHDKVGRNTMRENTKTFFDFVDESWGIKSVTFKEGAAHLRQTFLICLALLFSRHETFWKGNRLFIDKDLKRKIASFPINDPQIRNLASSGGHAGKILLQYMLEHVNSGKRTRRLVERKFTASETMRVAKVLEQEAGGE